MSAEAPRGAQSRGVAASFAPRDPGHRAPWAVRPEASRGRLHPEPADARSPFGRDRDRIIHSRAFRRLQYKTQVFVFHEGDSFRTRLTHSIEVAQIARSLARRLRLDEDLAEALALAHDLGHPPFGHAGEEALDSQMRPYGGFDHNAQSLKVVTLLEQRYASFDGLNLTWETLEGLAKHNGPLRRPAPAIEAYNRLHDLELTTHASAEAQVASLADDIAYNNHDLDDGIRAGLFTLEEAAQLPHDRRGLRRNPQGAPGRRARTARGRDGAPGDQRDGRGRGGRSRASPCGARSRAPPTTCAPRRSRWSPSPAP